MPTRFSLFGGSTGGVPGTRNGELIALLVGMAFPVLVGVAGGLELDAAGETWGVDEASFGSSTGIGTVGTSVMSGRWLKRQWGRWQRVFSGQGRL